MKFCPVCQTRFDEEILRFCTKDGSPLVEENPTFRELPSEEESAEDIDEETLIRRNRQEDEAPLAQPFPDQRSTTAQRIVISTGDDDDFSDELAAGEPVRARTATVPPAERKSSTALVVLATMFGTFSVLAVLFGIWYFLSNRKPAETNTNKIVNVNSPNTNADPNANSNAGSPPFDFNVNTNANANTNVNINANANLKTPTPTRTPTPTPTPPNTNMNGNVNTDPGNTNVTRPTPSPTPPAANTSPTPPANVNVGVINSRAISLTKPAYPQAARQANASGEVRVQVSVDENGNVTAARAVSGHTLLRSPAENAARQSRFNPIRVGDRAVPATGIIVYNFINQ